MQRGSSLPRRVDAHVNDIGNGRFHVFENGRGGIGDAGMWRLHASYGAYAGPRTEASYTASRGNVSVAWLA